MIDIEAIKKRVKAATAGKWKRGNAGCVWDNRYENIIAECPEAKNADFIFEARQDIPLLIDEIERLRKIEAAATETLDSWRWWTEDQYDRSQSVVSDAFHDLSKALAEEMKGV